jgi:hypothetical protein
MGGVILYGSRDVRVEERHDQKIIKPTRLFGLQQPLSAGQDFLPAVMVQVIYDHV